MAMLRPTYSELIEKANVNVEEGGKPVVTSRYSIVLAAAKRARQIISEEPDLIETPDKKPLSVAVEEINVGKVQILGDGE